MHSAVKPTQDRPNLGHSVYGQGPEKVLVFHDWMGDSANYEPIIPYLDPGVHMQTAIPQTRAPASSCGTSSAAGICRSRASPC
jgi:hypothetical protein